MRTKLLLKSHLALSLVLLLTTASVIQAAADNDEKNDNKPSDEADKAKQVATTNSICSSCQCDLEKGILDCSDRNLSQNFKPSDFEALNKTMKLTSAFFKYNQIRNITIYPNVSIAILDLSNNQISLIKPRAFANLAQLTELNLSRNRLNSTILRPEIFEGDYDPVLYEPLKKLRILNLSGNDIHRLDADLFEHTPNLEDLDLSENPLMVIDSGTEIALTGITGLKRLHLGDTQLRTLPQHLFHAPRGLLWLNLEGNLFQTIPEAFLYANNLDTLILDENPIMRIGSKTSKFPAMTKLTKLSISNMNSLERIENHGLSNLENLEELNCTDNAKLNFIHSGALSRPGKEDASDTEWPPMKKLHLQNNNLSIIEANLIGRWDNMEEVDLSNNPWLCDCKTQWIIDVLLDKYGKAERNVKDVICQYPLENTGTKMIDLEHETLKCVDFKDGRVSRDGAVMVGVLIGVLVGVPIALMLFLIYKRGCFGLVANGPADFSRAFYKRTAQDDMNF